MATGRSRRSESATPRLLAWAALGMLATGCGTLPPPTGPAGPAEPAIAEEPAPTPAIGEFTVSASRIDTWNAVGQILVRLSDVVYQGRSQMLGIYAVRYDGEEFLIETRARVLSSPSAGVATRVGVILPDDRQTPSPAAGELLTILQERLPAELARLAADEDYQRLLTPPDL